MCCVEGKRIFCGEPHNVLMTYKGRYNDENSQTISFNEVYTSNLVDISKFGTKINFKSEKEFIFSYSFVDVTDDNVLYGNPAVIKPQLNHIIR